MGRSRGNFHSADEDPTQRSRRKKNASSGENSESASAGQGASEGKRALYHCNYCNKDITGKIRIKCAVCPDFDLCIECFSVGAEVTPHKSNHPYRVMDNLSFPLICADWNADDEILLLEGIEMYGLGNWAEIAEHVGTKSKEQCIEHYTNVYMSSPYFPLPVWHFKQNEFSSELQLLRRVSRGAPAPCRQFLLLQASPASPQVHGRMLTLTYSLPIVIKRLESIKIPKSTSRVVVCASKGPRPRYPRVWKSRNRIGTISKSSKLLDCIMKLSNVKEEVYGALDSFIAWELEFPLITVKKALKTLENQGEWKRIIQVTKWMLSKGQGRTMGSYFTLLNALAEDGRLDEAEELWTKLFTENLESTPRIFFDKMISIYYKRAMHEKMFEIFADMEELSVRPNVSIVSMVGNVFKELGMMDKYNKLKKKYPPPKWEYRYIKGKRIKIKAKHLDESYGSNEDASRREKTDQTLNVMHEKAETSSDELDVEANDCGEDLLKNEETDWTSNEFYGEAETSSDELKIEADVSS